MVIIASHTAGGNLTVFLPRKHPRLCPRSLTTWIVAKLSSSYYNHLITEAPPCALPVFFFFFLLLYLQDCCETCYITSKVILMRECTGITCCSKWCPHDNGRAEVDQTGEHLIQKKNTKKNYCAPACTGVCFTSAFTKKDSLVFLFRSEASEKKLTFAVWAALLGEIATNSPGVKRCDLRINIAAMRGEEKHTAFT